MWGTLGPVVALFPEASSGSFALFRLLSGTLVLWILLQARRWTSAPKAAPDRVSWTGRDRWFTAIGGVGVATYLPLYFGAVATTGITTATFVSIGAAPFMVGAFAALTGVRRPGVKWWLATLLAVIGVCTLSAGTDSAVVSLPGILMALGAAASYAAQTIAIGALAPRHGSPTTVFGIFAVGTALSLPLAFGSELSWISTPGLLVAAAYAGIITLAIAYACFAAGARIVGASTAATLSLVEPVVAMGIAILAFGERPSVLSAIGCLIVIVGLTLCGWAGHTASPTLSADARDERTPTHS